MERLKKLFIILAVLAVAACSSSKVIKPKKLYHIFYDMYLTDSYLDHSPDFRAMADTSAVYAAVLEKHGYTTDDFLSSLSYYIDKDPKALRAVFDKLRDQFQKEASITDGDSALMESEESEAREETDRITDRAGGENVSNGREIPDKSKRRQLKKANKELEKKMEDPDSWDTEGFER
ncbi:MAG: DUF4296 domain-containing protein [Bacteroidales bacterium]|nr:DUF4296 domain-containing protein [Bacteroidales bacterium]